MNASFPEGAPGAPRPSALFALLWQTLSNLIGTPATATLLRRGIKRAAQRRPQLAEVDISRAEHDYVFSLPRGWEAGEEEAREDLRALFVELHILARQLTGSVIIRRLTAMKEFAALQPSSSEDTTT
ncbi:MAG: hypothetical protein ABW123_08490 [Cystobacter sp.]